MGYDSKHSELITFHPSGPSAKLKLLVSGVLLGFFLILVEYRYRYRDSALYGMVAGIMEWHCEDLGFYSVTVLLGFLYYDRLVIIVRTIAQSGPSSVRAVSRGKEKITDEVEGLGKLPVLCNSTSTRKSRIRNDSSFDQQNLNLVRPLDKFLSE